MITQLACATACGIGTGPAPIKSSGSVGRIAERGGVVGGEIDSFMTHSAAGAGRRTAQFEALPRDFQSGAMGRAEPRRLAAPPLGTRPTRSMKVNDQF